MMIDAGQAGAWVGVLALWRLDAPKKNAIMGNA